MATIYQKGSDSVYDLNGVTYYAGGTNAGKLYNPTTPSVTPSNPYPTPQQNVPVASSVNPNAGYYTPTPTPVTTLSSTGGAKTVNNNTQSLQTMEQAYIPPPQTDTSKSSYTVKSGDTLSGIARSQGASTSDISGYRSGDPNLIYPGEQLTILRKVTGSAASGAMVDDINNAIQGGGLSEQEAQGLKDLTATQDGLVAAAAAARAALDAKDYTSMDFHVKRAEEMQKAYTKQLSDYYAAVAPLRQRQMDLLSPSARERQLSTSLNDIRGQIDQFNLQTEEDKFREYEGQTLGFAGGRASEIDIRASFKRQEMALKEKNLLASLGLEQDARKMEKDAVDDQLGYLADDFELQSKVQDKLTEAEDALFERADTLRAESKDSLVKIMDMLQGVDPSKIPSATRAEIETLAARSGLPFEIVQQALKTQYDRQVFEDALKMKQEARLSSSAGEEKAGTLEERQAGAIASYAAAFVPGASIGDGIPVMVNGKLSYEAWKQAIADAPSEGLTREAFIKAFGHLLATEDGDIPAEYGLTAKEKVLVLGS